MPKRQRPPERLLSNKEIGVVFGTSISTVRTQLQSAMAKLRVTSRSELAYLAFCESHRVRGAPATPPPTRA